MDSKQAYLQCLEKLIWALDRLEAKGWLRWQRCKHVDSLLKLTELKLI